MTYAIGPYRTVTLSRCCFAASPKAVVRLVSQQAHGHDGSHTEWSGQLQQLQLRPQHPSGKEISQTGGNQYSLHEKSAYKIAISRNFEMEDSMGAIAFDFDPKEGLGDGFLTPVYFDNEVLVKHLYSKTIAVEFASETYGTVHWPDGYMSFGINSKGAIIAWLGDLMELSIAEQHHWREHNIPAQNDMKSEFFDAQINAQFTEHPIGIQVINALEEWNIAFARKNGIEIYKPKAFVDRIEAVRRYRRIIINSEDDFIRFVSELNEIINESVDNDQIRYFLKLNNVTPKEGSKGNKLLEMTYRDLLGDTKNLIAPFFWLYDLRLWADHDMGDNKLRDVAVKLGIADLNDFEAIFTKLLEHLRDTLVELKATYG